MNNKRTVVVFDFDGTITKKDTLLEFIKFACGSYNFYYGILRHSFFLIMMKLRLYPNWKCKQKVFSWFFKGMSYSMFRQLGIDFEKKIQSMLRVSTINTLRAYLEEGFSVYVVSASIEEWVRPYCESLGVKDVLCTRIEVDDEGLITGRFSTHNCYGKEKVYRFLEIEPNRESYYLYVYGDSEGDKDLIEFADRGSYI